MSVSESYFFFKKKKRFKTTQANVVDKYVLVMATGEAQGCQARGEA